MNKESARKIKIYFREEGIKTSYQSHLLLKSQERFSNVLLVISGLVGSSPALLNKFFDEYSLIPLIIGGIGFLYFFSKSEKLKNASKNSLRLSYVLFNEFFKDKYDSWCLESSKQGFQSSDSFFRSKQKKPKSNQKFIQRDYKFDFDLDDYDFCPPLFKKLESETESLNENEYIVDSKTVWRHRNSY